MFWLIFLSGQFNQGEYLIMMFFSSISMFGLSNEMSEKKQQIITKHGLGSLNKCASGTKLSVTALPVRKQTEEWSKDEQLMYNQEQTQNRIFTYTTLYCTATSDACSFGRHKEKHIHAPGTKGADHNTYMHHQLDAKKKNKNKKITPKTEREHCEGMCGGT